jgi:hypothetical protein
MRTGRQLSKEDQHTGRSLRGRTLKGNEKTLGRSLWMPKICVPPPSVATLSFLKITNEDFLDMGGDIVILVI